MVLPTTTTTLHNDIVKELQDLIMTLGIDGVKDGDNDNDDDNDDSSKETNEAKLELERLVNSTRALIRTNHEIWEQIESSQVAGVASGGCDDVNNDHYDKKLVTFRRKGYMSIDITMSRSSSSSSSLKSSLNRSSSHEETLEESLNRVLEKENIMPTPTLSTSTVDDDKSNNRTTATTTTTVATQFRYEYRSFPSLFDDIPCLPILGLIPSNYSGRRNRQQQTRPPQPPQTQEEGQEKEQWFDYDSYMDHILLLHPTITKLFLHFFKHHLQTIQVQLGTIHSWLIIEPMYGIQLINEIFHTNLSLNDDNDIDDKDDEDDGHFMEENHHHHNHDDGGIGFINVHDTNGQLSSTSTSSYTTMRRKDTSSSSSFSRTLPKPIVLHQKQQTTACSSSVLPGLFMPSAQLSLVGGGGGDGSDDGYDTQLDGVKQFLQLILS